MDEHDDLADRNSQSATHHVFPGDQHAGCSQILGCFLLHDFAFCISGKSTVNIQR